MGSFPLIQWRLNGKNIQNRIIGQAVACLQQKIDAMFNQGLFF